MGLRGVFRARRSGITFMGSLLLVTIFSLVSKNHLSAQKSGTNTSSDSNNGSTHLSIDHKTVQNSTDSAKSLTSSPSINSNANDSSTSLVVNGQSIKVPKNGSVHKSITSNSGQTHVNISITDGGSANNSSNSSTNVNINSNSNSDQQNSVQEEHVSITSP